MNTTREIVERLNENIGEHVRILADNDTGLRIDLTAELSRDDREFSAGGVTFNEEHVTGINRGANGRDVIQLEF